MELRPFFFGLLVTSMGLEVYGQWMSGQESLSTPKIIEPQKMLSVPKILKIRGRVKSPPKSSQPSPTILRSSTTTTTSSPTTLDTKHESTFHSLKLSLGLHGELMNTNRDKNILFSPPTFSLALTMLSLQASPQTRKKVLKGLNFPSRMISGTPSYRDHYNVGKFLQSLLPSSEGCQTELRSFVIGTQTYEQLQDKFVNMAWDSYHTNVSVYPPVLPLPTEHQTGAFKEKKTQGQKGPIRERNGFDVASGIFFKGQWTNSFENKWTMPFRVRSDFWVTVPAMQHKGMFRLQHCSPLKSYVLQLPYTCNSTSYFILPDDRSNRATENIPLYKYLEDWVQPFPPSLWKLNIPIFTVSGISFLENLLPKMGFSDIFNPSQAGIRGIFVKDQSYSINSMLHRTQLTVDETGVKNKNQKEYMFRMRTFYFNRPFLLVILTQNNEVILMGRVMNPTDNT